LEVSVPEALLGDVDGVLDKTVEMLRDEWMEAERWGLSMP
jgi:hypothetical protein